MNGWPRRLKSRRGHAQTHCGVTRTTPGSPQRSPAGTPQILNLQGLNNRLLSSIERRRRRICSGLSPHGPPRVVSAGSINFGDLMLIAILCTDFYPICRGRAPRIVLRIRDPTAVSAKTLGRRLRVSAAQRMPSDPNSRPVVGTRQATSRPGPRSRSAFAIKGHHAIRKFARKRPVREIQQAPGD